jgi:periplasmic copper chaperone A
MKRTTMGIATIAALVLPTQALAHISLHPNTIPAGAFATVYVRVPGEQAGAYVKKVDMLFPPGFTSAEYENVSGWSVKVSTQKLATPIQTDGGSVDEEVSQVIWTWTGPLGQVSDNQFIQFPLSLAIPENLAGHALQFKTVQTYSNGQVVHWIEPSLEAEHPAPTIDITARGGAVEDIAGKEAGPEPGQLHTVTRTRTVVESRSGASKGLAIAAFLIGALGLLIALFALAASRRTRSSA